MAELKPCPWCKNKNIQICVDYDEFDGRDYYQMVCQKCRAGGPWKTTEQQATDAWNKRSK